MEAVFLWLSVSAIAVMIYAAYLVVVLKKRIPGGVVGRTWRVLSGLIFLFLGGYLATPFFPLLPQAFKDLLVGFIFLFGAVFVAIVIKLFYKVVSDIGL